MENCCTVDPVSQPTPDRCPVCGALGHAVARVTVKALLRPEALARLSAADHRFCRAAHCPVVYFGKGDTFSRSEIAVPVFQKEPAGARTVCYCFAITEGDIRRELEQTANSTAFDRIAALVKSERCACEVKNPQGACCLGNVAAATKALNATLARLDPGPHAR